jgi:hypothetical protein
MPNLDFQIVSVEAVFHGITPLLHFHLQITSRDELRPVQGLLLAAQIQLQCPQRAYSPTEKEKLLDLFGAPERWGQTLRNRFWTYSNATVGSFHESTEAVLPVPCTYDLNVASAKYFYGLEGGDVSLLFLFSGSVFYSDPDGRLQVEPIPWSKECVYRFPVTLWKELMKQHYPNSAWLSLRHDVFDQLCEYKRQAGFATWEQAISALLSEHSSRDRDPRHDVNIAPEVPA